jgi:hypothetical protein
MAHAKEMKMGTFKKAVRSQSKLRLALLGPSGAGKTYTALSIAKHIGKRIAVIDSERGSASLYAGDVADFDVLELETFAPANYVQAIHAAEREGYDVIVVDSLTQAWSGKGGALEMVDAAQKRSRAQNSFTAWRDITPEHNALVDALVGARAHVICTMRVKTAYELQEDERGKKVPVKLGLAPIQRDGLEYEFTIVGDLDLDHVLTISKTRCAVLDRGVFRKPGADLAGTIMDWLNQGDAAPARAPLAAVPPPERDESPADAGPTKAEQIAMLVDIDLPKCLTAEHLTFWSRALLSLTGKVNGAPAWKAFADRCASLEVSPRDVVNAAQLLSATRPADAAQKEVA